MSARCHRQFGFGLIELSIGIAIVALLLAVAAPSMSDWIQNTQIRTSAEATQNGLQLARAAAVQRNANVRFQLTDSLTASCAVSASGGSWVVSLDDPAGACSTTPSDTVAPRIIQKRDSSEGSRNAVVAAGQAAITFNGLGRVTPVPAGDISIDVSHSSGTCAASGGTRRCLRVVVSTAGQIRMCDPARASSDPQGC